MKFQTKLTLCKAVFIFIAIVVCALWAFEFRIAAVVVLLIDYIFDFITRRCPFCVLSAAFEKLFLALLDKAVARVLGEEAV